MCSSDLSRYSSTHSVQDAHDLAERTGLTLREVPIGPMFDAFQSSLHLTGLAEENLQARIRGMVLMSLSNAEGHLVLATGNKSELSVGYSTIYGDAVGGFAPIKDVPKTLVWDLARWRNEQAGSAGSAGPIPPRSITKEPSAELGPDQKDSDSLPDYHDLDSVLEAYVDDDTGASELVSAGFDAALNDGAVDRSADLGVIEIGLQTQQGRFSRLERRFCGFDLSGQRTHLPFGEVALFG